MALEPEKRQQLDGIANSLATIRLKVEGDGPATEAIDAAMRDFHATIDRVIEQGKSAVDALVREFAEVIARKVVGLGTKKAPPPQDFLDKIKRECPFMFTNRVTKTRELLLILGRQLSTKIPGEAIAEEMGIEKKAVYAVASNLGSTLRNNRSIYSMCIHNEEIGFFSYELVCRDNDAAAS